MAGKLKYKKGGLSALYDPKYFLERPGIICEQ